MSYSRWLSSIWYTFWCSTEFPFRDDQIFEICAIKSFTYKQLKQDINGCLKIAYEIANNDLKDGCTKKQLKELKGYMKEFIKDVESDEEINEAELVKSTKETKLPLLMAQVKTEIGRNLLAQRLRGTKVDEDSEIKCGLKKEKCFFSNTGDMKCSDCSPL